MDDKTYKERVNRLRELDKVVKTLDPTIREASFRLLQAYVTGSKTHTDPNVSGDEGSGGSSILGTFDHDKPADNVLLVTAEHFRKYGDAPFVLEEVRTTARNAGLTIPERLDKTLTAASRNGKKLFAKVARGRFKPTVHGEKFFKETYSVSKGTSVKPGEDEK
ncbi:MAG TPA: hypothetical protein ENO19_04680 [Halothiobacillaceae bacterium]|nr:hypothetical protein [Halothiobacillaceae bacterium]